HLGYGVVDAEKILSINLPSTRDDVPESFDKAFTLKNGEVYAEKINMPGDQDWYHLNVSQCGKMTIRFPEVSSPNDLHTVVGVQLKDREIYAKHVVDDKGIGGEETYSFQIAPGNYYLIVSDMNKHWSSRSYKVTGMFESTDELMIFPDSRNHWAKREISYLTKCGIIEGFPNGTFHPDESITRAQAAKIISEELRLPPNESDFPDVESSKWYAPYVGAVEKAGIIIGYPDGEFRPEKTLSRAEMAKILVKAYALTGDSSQTFTDVKKDFWAKSYIQTLVANGIAVGYPDQTFRPTAKMTRAEFSAMEARVLNDSFISVP
ncbi:MAG TPA: S-layer homology domain-containing protein, partial [Bacillales bacterium]